VFKQSVMGRNSPHVYAAASWRLTAHDNRAEPRYPRSGAPIHPEQPRGTKGTTTRLTIAGNRKFESTSLQRRVCEPVRGMPIRLQGAVERHEGRQELYRAAFIRSGLNTYRQRLFALGAFNCRVI
jgi:hypothetical protein